MGASFIQKGMKAIPMCLITGIVHGILEAIVVMMFFMGGISSPAEGYSITAMVIITGVGTFAHHCVDFAIAYIVGKALARAKMLKPLPKLF